jgi:hypothetical protein
MRTKIINGIRVELTAEENQQRDLEEQIWSEKAFDRAIAKLRDDRNNKISRSDYLALSDQSLSQEWADYRQALRDLTQGLETVEDVGAVVWPSEPSE